MPPAIKAKDSSGTLVSTPIPGWLVVWFWVVNVILIVMAVLVYFLWHFRAETYKWNMQMRRWAAHYYYCDSGHKDDAKCALWSDHIPPPPPPPQY